MAQHIHRLLRALGLEEVKYRPFLVGVTSGEPWTDFLPATIESVRSTLLGKGLIVPAELDAALATCRRHLADPDTVFTSYLIVQTWGRKPGPEAQEIGGP